MQRMLGMRGPAPIDRQGLPPEVAALIAQLQQQVQARAKQLSERDALLQRKDREIALRETRIERINFELARLTRWIYGAKSEAMNAGQRRLFEEMLVKDEAALREQLERLRRQAEADAAGWHDIQSLRDVFTDALHGAPAASPRAFGRTRR